MQNNDLMQLEKKLSSLGGVPLTHGALVSMLNEYRAPNDKIICLIDKAFLLLMPIVIRPMNQLSIVKNCVALPHCGTPSE